jgi:response regulator RpfG family c-di-GMP phosphodiesterase
MNQANTSIADKLLADGLISQDKYEGALHHHRSFGGFIEEALLAVKAIEEDVLLKQLAQYHRTRFVATEKLKRAEISRTILEKLSADFAEKQLVLPILFDEQKSTLSVVTANPQDLELEQQIARIAGVQRVQSFVARPAAIKAAISKHYKGDIHAFATIDADSIKEFQSMMNIYERNLLDEGAMAAAVVSPQQAGERTISADEMERRGAQATQRAAAEGTTGEGLVSLETLRVLVSLLESSRAELSGHSILTARHTESMCRRIGLTEYQTAAVTMAALLHDIGKGSPYHLTSFNVAEWKGHRITAEKRFETPVRLLESGNLPMETVGSLRHMYERPDGKGFPDGLRGADIPLGARILSMADTFADLTSNPRNPYRRALDTNEAMEVLNKGKGTVFDSNLVDLFGTVVAGDDIKRKLLTGAQTLLVVDSDPEACAILDMQLTTRGFRIKTANAADEAIRMLIDEPASLVVSDVELKPFDGFELKNRLNDDDRTRDIPLIYFTSRAASADVQKGFDLGATDYLAKPSSIDVLAAKVNKYLTQTGNATSTGGVSGSLREMSIPDLVQILSHGRKTGRLALTSGRHRGEVHFVQGDIYNALLDNLRGEEAFFAMLKFRDGSFALDPKFTAGERVIQMTSEMLLLEGLRRFDEDNR